MIGSFLASSSGMLKISYSSLSLYYCHLLSMYIYYSNPLERFPPMKCCLTGRGTGFGKAHCSHNISASDPIGMNAMQQKSLDCLKTCLKDPQCQTYEYNSDDSCWLGFKIYQDCFSYLVNKFSKFRLLYEKFIGPTYLFDVLNFRWFVFSHLRSSSHLNVLILLFIHLFAPSCGPSLFNRLLVH